MTDVLVVLSLVLAIAWIPVAIRFKRSWVDRRNPISLAICAATALYTYSNTLTAIELLGNVSWHFVLIATHAFNAIVVMNFYAAFRWADKKFPEARGRYSIPPINTGNTPL